jgi:hypothetical protein
MDCKSTDTQVMQERQPDRINQVTQDFRTNKIAEVNNAIK